GGVVRAGRTRSRPRASPRARPWRAAARAWVWPEVRRARAAGSSLARRARPLRRRTRRRTSEALRGRGDTRAARRGGRRAPAARLLRTRRWRRRAGSLGRAGAVSRRRRPQLVTDRAQRLDRVAFHRVADRMVAEPRVLEK